MTQPPGCSMTTSPHLPNTAPSRHREDRIPVMASSGISPPHTHTGFTLIPPSTQATSQPRLLSRLTIRYTSAILGQLRMQEVSLVSSEAAKIGSAAFLEP